MIDNVIYQTPDHPWPVVIYHNIIITLLATFGFWNPHIFDKLYMESTSESHYTSARGMMHLRSVYNHKL